MSASLTPRFSARSTLSLFYVTSFTFLGVYMTFFPLWLRHERGIGAQEIAWVWSAATLARTIAGPLWSQRVDRSGRPQQTLLWLSLGSFVAFLGFLTADSVSGLVGWSFLFGCFYPPIHAIHDTLVMRTARRAGFVFSQLRAIGSVAFLVAVLAAGFWLDTASESTIYWILLAALLAMLLSSFALPADVPGTGAAAGAGEMGAPIGALLASGPFVLLLLSSGLIQGSHAVYYSYSALHWQSHGIAESTTGQLWAEGVLAEIVLFFVARASIDRLRPTTLLMMGGVFGAVRWLVLGSTVSVPVLFLVNWLHAVSFGCTFLGALRAIERRVPAGRRTTAQGLHGAAAMGLGIVLAALLGGYLFESSPAAAFYAMGVLALLGAGLGFVLRRRGITAAMSDQASAPTSPE